MEEMDWKYFLADYDGKCAECGTPIAKGDKVKGRKRSSGKWKIICYACGKEGEAKLGIKPEGTPLGGKVPESSDDFDAVFHQGEAKPKEVAPVKPGGHRKDSLEQFRENAAWGL